MYHTYDLNNHTIIKDLELGKFPAIFPVISITAYSAASQVEKHFKLLHDLKHIVDIRPD